MCVCMYMGAGEYMCRVQVPHGGFRSPQRHGCQLPNVGSKNRTRVLWESSRSSYLLSQLSSPSKGTWNHANVQPIQEPISEGTFQKGSGSEREKKARDQVEMGEDRGEKGYLLSLRTFWAGWGLHRRAFRNGALGGTFCPGWVLRAQAAEDTGDGSEVSPSMDVQREGW